MNKNEIVKMIHCDSAKCEQKRGIQLALLEEDLSFIMNISSDRAYAENCSLIFTSLEYVHCQKYFDDLFSWIEDLNTVGAIQIYEYLVGAPGKLLLESFSLALNAAVKRKNEEMIKILHSIVVNNKELFSLMKDNYILYCDFKKSNEILGKTAL